MTQTEPKSAPGRGPTRTAPLLTGALALASMPWLASLLAHVQSGKVRALVVTGPRRMPQLASVPTMIESGFPGFDVTGWQGLCAPAGTPTLILEKLHADLTKVLQMPDVLQRFSDLVFEAAPQSRDEFATFMRAETTRWAQVVKDAGIPRQ